MQQHYFDVPFAFSGDKTSIPDPLQAGGTVSFTEGWNYNYQRNLATDPAALPIDRSTMNWLFNSITVALQALQTTGVPEWITAAQNGGTSYAYGKGSVVLYSAGGTPPFTKYVSLITANTDTPGATGNWQVVADAIATSAQATAGTDNTTIMTPALVAQQDALRALLAGNGAQVFNVALATAATHAPRAAQVQQGLLNYAGAAGGTANAITATLAPAPTSYTDDLMVIVRTGFANTGAVTLNVNGLGAVAAVGVAHSPLQGSELAANGFACFVYSAAISSFVLAWSTGGAEQVGVATQSMQAAQLGQLPSVVGSARNLAMIVAAASATATLTADEVVLETQLGSSPYRLSAFSQTINLGATGAGGMDTGTAPLGGYVAIYAICNITGSTRALLAVNATSAVANEVYSGANMPSGYVASALVGVWPTDASGRFQIGVQLGRWINRQSASIINTQVVQASYSSLGIANAVPRNAKRAKCVMSGINNTVSTVQTVGLAMDANGTGQQLLTSGVVLANNGNQCCGTVDIATPQTIYYLLTNNGGGTPTFNASVVAYEF